MAYSGVRSAGMNKKIANWVDNNIWNFQKGDEKIKKFLTTLEETKIWEEHKTISDELGNCFLTTLDVFDSVVS